MDNLLEKIIREHAGKLFGSEPLQGHRDRFAVKLDAMSNNKSKRRFSVYKLISYAAIAAIFAGCVFFFHRVWSSTPDESENLSEVQNYYSLLLQDEIDAIEPLLHQVEENERVELMDDIKNLQKEAESNIQESDDKNEEFVVMTYLTTIQAVQHIHDVLTYR